MELGNMDSPVEEYKINVPEEQLILLHNRLELARFPSPSPVSNDWQFGTPVSQIERLVRYWRNACDWRAAESTINRLPQFRTIIKIQGFGDINLHFVHVKSGQPKSLPLLFCHGWPGSFIEVEKIVPLLTETDNGLVFDVVAPSLPNFGFSQGIDTPGFRPPQYAEALHKLMLRLGYNRYVTQGGDWGFTITRYMGFMFPDHCFALHFNFVWANPPRLLRNPLQYLKSWLPLSKEEDDGLKRSMWFAQECTGYSVLQGNKPVTVAMAWTDSPIALLSWIYEKLHDWTDDYPWTDDEILDWVSIYQFSTAGAHSSARIYYETNHPSPLTEPFQWVPTAKLGISYFPKDVALPPMCWGRILGPVVFDVWHKRGGHFAAHEVPEELAQDVRNTFRKAIFDV